MAIHSDHKILIADEDDLDKQRLIRLLGRLPCQIIDSITVSNLVDFADQHKPDLIILEIYTRDRIGIKTVIELKSRFPSIPVIVLSGMESSLLKISEDMGADIVLPKHKNLSYTGLLNYIKEFFD